MREYARLAAAVMWLAPSRTNAKWPAPRSTANSWKVLFQSGSGAYRQERHSQPVTAARVRFSIRDPLESPLESPRFSHRGTSRHRLCFAPSGGHRKSLPPPLSLCIRPAPLCGAHCIARREDGRHGSLCTCLDPRNIPCSVARLKMDPPLHNCLAYNRLHMRSAGRLSTHSSSMHQRN